MPVGVAVRVAKGVYVCVIVDETDNEVAPPSQGGIKEHAVEDRVDGLVMGENIHQQNLFGT